MRLFTSIVVAFLAANSSAYVTAKEFSFYHENVIGTSLELRVLADSEAVAISAEQAVLQEVDRLASVLSHYQPDSEFSRFLRLSPGTAISASADLTQVLTLCDKWMRLSKGAFNPAAELHSQTWKQATINGVLPGAEQLAGQAARIAGPHWRISSDAQQVSRMSNVPLSLNAIAKGYILDQVVSRVLSSQEGVQGIVLNIGGDIRAAGNTSTFVHVADPSADAIGGASLRSVLLENAAIATSGHSERGFEIAGKKYSHLIDPRTGVPVGQIRSATVIAPNATTADVVATICCVLQEHESLSLVKQLPSVECLLVSTSKRVITSSGWPAEQLALADISANESTESDELPSETDAVQQTGETKAQAEYLIEFEITQPAGSGGRYRRPYVAVWVEDEEGFSVKTLSLFLMQRDPGPRWHRDLRRWYANDRVRKVYDDRDLIEIVSKPTRRPGDYKVTWDGTDDFDKPLKPGDYTLFIEAAREHGTYQLIRQPFTIGSDSFTHRMKGNVEIGSASFRFEKAK